MNGAVGIANRRNHLWDAEHFIKDNWTDHNVMIRVWKFEDAPLPLKALADNHDKKTWVVLVPPKHKGYINWADCDGFGTCGTDWYRLDCGWQIGIGCSGCVP